MAYDEHLADRLRKVFTRQCSVSEKKMFGGLTFMLRGHMCCGVMNDELVVRVGANKGQAALNKPHTRQFDVTGRPMNGMIVVSSPGIQTDASLKRWARYAIEFVSTLPDREGSRK